MAWYWILAIIVGYLLVGGIVAGVVEAVEDIDDGIMMLIVLGWPLLVISGIVAVVFYGVCYASSKLGILIVDGIVSAGEWICDSVQRWVLKRKIKRLDKRASHRNETFETIEKDDIDYDEDPISDKRRR